MFRKDKYSNNFKISRDLMRKRRQIDENVHIHSEILLTFLYKYLSDNLKEYLDELMKNNNFTFYEAYNNKEHYDFIEEKSLSEFGYFFTMPDMFMDNLIESNYESSFLDRILFDVLKEGIEFNEGSNAKKYFDLLIDDCYEKVYRGHFHGDVNYVLRDFILLISKLDINEEEFKYSQVFDAVVNSRIVGARGTPEYIYDLMVPIISESKNIITNAYNPFLNDGSTLVSLYNNCAVYNVYGKDKNRINFLTSIVNMIINGINCDHIFFSNESALEYMKIDDISFDAIISKVPNRFRERHLEYRKKSFFMEDEKEDLKNQLLSNLNMKSEDLNMKMEKHLDNFILEVASDAYQVSEFYGEYESLKDNEYLFIIEMINSLKDDGIMVISISQNFLFKNSQQIMRKFLTFENNYLDAVIGLPEELGRSIRPEVILVFKKNKTDENILFIDSSKNYSTKMSDNRVPGAFRKFLLFDDESKKKVIDCYFERKTIDKFSNLVSIKEIYENEFNLSISRYVDTYEGEFIDLKDLDKDKKEIDKKMDHLSKEINKLLDDLDIKL